MSQFRAIDGDVLNEVRNTLTLALALTLTPALSLTLTRALTHPLALIRALTLALTPTRNPHPRS